MSGEEVGTCTTSNPICPSKSTVYLGNISYSLTNNDLIKIVEHCGKVVCAKVVKDRLTRKSKGYAFIQFLNPDDAVKCVEEYNGSENFGRKWNCSIAIDNGRTAEFIRKREYPDKSRCYECGEYGHLSYRCSKNALGDREPPPKKKRKRKYKPPGASLSSSSVGNDDEDSENDEESDDEVEVEADSLNSAINYQRQMAEEQEYREAVASGDYRHLQQTAKEAAFKTRKFVKDGYFSDEEALEDE